MAPTSLPSFSQLRAFVALCDHQHFGEAASALGVSQPSLSQAITALERRVGGELVERTTRRVLVTPLGETLLPFAREAVLAAESFSEAVTTHGAALSGTLRLGIIPTLAPYLTPVLIDSLPEALPQLTLELREMVTNDLIDQLCQGKLDAAIVALDHSIDTNRVTLLPMFSEPLIAIVSPEHPWSGRSDINTDELDSHRLLLLDEGNCLRDQALSLCQRWGSNPPAAVATTLQTVAQMVSHGSGYTIIPEGSLLQLGADNFGIAHLASQPTRRLALAHRASSSRNQDFQMLANTIVDVALKAQLPIFSEAELPLNAEQPTSGAGALA